MGKDNNKVTNEEVEAVLSEVRKQQVVKVKPKRVKKGLMERMVVAMIGPDGLPAVGRYVTKEVIGPAVKNMLVDSVINGIQMMVFRDENIRPVRSNTGNYYNGKQSTSVRKTDYSARYGGQQTYPSQAPRYSGGRQLGAGMTVQEYAIPDRNDAQKVLNSLMETAYEYGVVKVRDYYDLIGVDSVYTDNNFGWKHDAVQYVRIRSTRDGFVLDLPPVEYIK